MKAALTQSSCSFSGGRGRASGAGILPDHPPYREFRYATRSSICCAVNLGQAIFFEFITFSMRGPCSHSADTMVMSDCPLTSFGAPLDGSLWHVPQLFSAKTFLPRSALPVPVKYCRAQM